MKKIVLLFLFVFPAIASAEFVPRCSTDAFGNEVCLDKDGVQSAAPTKSASAGGKAASGVPEAGSEEMKQPKRCAVDSFGNTVCSQ